MCPQRGDAAVGMDGRAVSGEWDDEYEVYELNDLSFQRVQVNLR